MPCFDLELAWPIISDFRQIGEESVFARGQARVLTSDGFSAVAAL